jgi:hypothetical protein
LKDECNPFDLSKIETCDNDPDLIHFTWDSRNPFTSACNGAGSCTTGDQTITHTCDKATCGAECETNNDCPITGICNSDCTCAKDTTPPVITISSPQNTTYYLDWTNTIDLTFIINEPTSWIGYSLDNKANITFGTNKPAGTYSTKVYSSGGSHNIIVYANDTSNNMGASQKVYFTAKIAMGGCGGPIWLGCRYK